MEISNRTMKNISEVGEILVKLATSENEVGRKSYLAAKGVTCLFDILAENKGCTLDDIDVPDFMKQDA